MEKDWREIIDMAAKCQKAITQVEDIKAILTGLEYDSSKIEAISAILGIKKEGD